ncbi:hypothetical protein AFLA_002622 [Aspergillus flavus NRRL3357]|nr:hypothetical protein AFLA_002622 [Aspergillus flavus NRRL3357]
MNQLKYEGEDITKEKLAGLSIVPLLEAEKSPTNRRITNIIDQFRTLTTLYFTPRSVYHFDAHLAQSLVSTNSILNPYCEKTSQSSLPMAIFNRSRWFFCETACFRRLKSEWLLGILIKTPPKDEEFSISYAKMITLAWKNPGKHGD